MADSRFWRTLAVMFVAGVFYLAHGLHDSGSVGSIPSLTHEVQAGDVSVVSRPNNAVVQIITTSEDGQTINVWNTNTSSSTVTFKGSYKAKQD
jgi:hypothetical protein